MPPGRPSSARPCITDIASWSSCCTARTSSRTAARCSTGSGSRSAGSERSHRVPRRKPDRLKLERLLQLARQILLAGGNLEHVLVEPRVVHREETLLPGVGAPRVLDSPTTRLAIEHVHS